MRLGSIVILISFFSITAYCQDSASKQPNTLLEKANLQVGTIIRKEYIDLYKFEEKRFFNSGNFNSQILKITDAATGLKTSGVQITTVSAGGSYSPAGRYTAYIDADELSALVKFFELCEDLKDRVLANYTEFIFNSKDLQFFAYYGLNNKSKKWEWNFGLAVDKFYKGSRVDLDLKTFSDFKNALLNNMNYFK
jgi:hypothetical protein